MLRQLATDLNLLADDTVVFLGKLPHPAVAREMQQAAALVSFSRAETFGCVLLEARATGCPVVGPATGGVPELFDSANTFGLLIPPDLEQAITTVLAGAFPFQPQALRADAQARCSYSEVGQQFAGLYAQVLSAPVASFTKTMSS
jgi:glycosyltransferase involved in cell wall biosynthesis